MFKCYIGLGSNLGDREGYLTQAIARLDEHPEIRVLRCSSIYETKPYGPVEQGDFLNMVVEIATALSPEALLDALQSIENALHRKRLVRWGPRTIDLDILLYGDKMIETEKLVVPHPEIAKRLFVLMPLNELAPDLAIPGIGQTVGERLKKFRSVKGVRLWKRNCGAGEFAPFEN